MARVAGVRLFVYLLKSPFSRLLEGLGFVFVELARDEGIAAIDGAVARDGDEGDGFGFPGFKAHGSAGGNVQAKAVGFFPVE